MNEEKSEAEQLIEMFLPMTRYKYSNAKKCAIVAQKILIERLKSIPASVSWDEKKLTQIKNFEQWKQTTKS